MLQQFDARTDNNRGIDGGQRRPGEMRSGSEDQSDDSQAYLMPKSDGTAPRYTKISMRHLVAAQGAVATAILISMLAMGGVLIVISNHRSPKRSIEDEHKSLYTHIDGSGKDWRLGTTVAPFLRSTTSLDPEAELQRKAGLQERSEFVQHEKAKLQEFLIERRQQRLAAEAEEKERKKEEEEEELAARKTTSTTTKAEHHRRHEGDDGSDSDGHDKDKHDSGSKKHASRREGHEEVDKEEDDHDDCDGTQNCPEPEGCRTAVEGEKCYKSIMWAKREGIHTHPEWYPGVYSTSRRKDYQAALAASGHGGCRLPCKWSMRLDEAPCLCVFDVDRTLTATQGGSNHCPGAEELPHVFDAAYGGGKLVVSHLARKMEDTFCGKCYRGIVTAGDVSGQRSDEREILLKLLGGIGATLSNRWSSSSEAESSLIVEAREGEKARYVGAIVEWFRKRRDITIAAEDVYFFDDSSDNLPSFHGTGFNAHQVSCKSRWENNSAIGNCGATSDEIIQRSGVSTCHAPLSFG